MHRMRLSGGVRLASCRETANLPIRCGQMLILKLTLVPFFIALITLAGRRWGSRMAGLLGGFPVVAGPIVTFLALEQGQAFGAQTAVATISAAAGVAIFSIAYSWVSLRWSWWWALTAAVGAWFVGAACLTWLPPRVEWSLVVAVTSLSLTPYLLPRVSSAPVTAGAPHDLPFRMLAGALLTLAVTSLASSVGAVWSGLLSVFPVLGSVLAVFIHRTQGAAQVVQMYKGMLRGLFSFIAYFVTLALVWTQVDFWQGCAMALAASIVMQGLLVWRAARG